MSPEARENQVINSAMNLAEEQILNGTASSQIITYFLKQGAQRDKDKLEKEKLQNEISLLKAKVEALRSSAHVDELYNNAIEAMKQYSGAGDSND